MDYINRLDVGIAGVFRNEHWDLMREVTWRHAAIVLGLASLLVAAFSSLENSNVIFALINVDFSRKNTSLVTGGDRGSHLYAAVVVALMGLISVFAYIMHAQLRPLIEELARDRVKPQNGVGTGDRQPEINPDNPPDAEETQPKTVDEPRGGSPQSAPKETHPKTERSPQPQPSGRDRREQRTNADICQPGESANNRDCPPGTQSDAIRHENTQTDTIQASGVFAQKTSYRHPGQTEVNKEIFQTYAPQVERRPGTTGSLSLPHGPVRTGTVPAQRTCHSVPETEIERQGKGHIDERKMNR